MKKIIFTLALLVIATIGFSQSKKIVTHVVADTGKVFTDYINIDDQIFVKSTGITYYSKVALQVPTTKNMAWMLASSARYGTPTVTTTSFNSKLDSNFVHTTGNETVYGIKTFTGASVFSGTNAFQGVTASAVTATVSVSAPLVAATTTLHLPGTTNTVTKTTGDANSVTFSHSLAVTDTATIPTATITKANVTTLNATGVTTLTGAFYAKTMIKNVTPTAKTASETMSTTTLLSGVIAVTQTGAVTLTTPAATDISTAITGSGQGTEFDLVIDNSASSVAGTVTLAFGSGVTAGTAVWTAEDTMTVTYGKVGCFHFYEVAAGDIRCYRKW